MWNSLAFLLAAPLLQDPAAQPAPAPAASNPARQAWEQAQQRLAAAQGLSLSARMELADPAVPAEELEPVAMELTLALARPNAGRASWITVFGEGDEAQTVRLEWIGNGEQVYAIDHEEKWVSAEGAEWKDSELGAFLPFLGPTWSLAAFEAQEFSLLPPPAGHPDWQGLKLIGLSSFMSEDEDAETVEMQLWLGPDGMFRRAVTSVGGTAVLKFEITAMELAEKIELKQHVVPIPEGYEILDADLEEAAGSGLDASLLPVGQAAPEVVMIGMDDAEIPLSSLRGKTVLLNFWFFH